jgi:hypothetical protein
MSKGHVERYSIIDLTLYVGRISAADRTKVRVRVRVRVKVVASYR